MLANFDGLFSVPGCTSGPELVETRGLDKVDLGVTGSMVDEDADQNRRFELSVLHAFAR
jgi:hypothetical protein